MIEPHTLHEQDFAGHEERCPNRLLIAAGILLIIITGIIIYSNTLNAPFVLDDLSAIVNNPYIRMTSFSKSAFSNILLCYSKYRPTANFTFALNYYFVRYNVISYHIVNIIVHLICGILLFLFLQLTFRLNTARQSASYKDFIRPEIIALIAAMLWLVNPLDTESVTYIVQRMNSMAAMFFLLSMYCYIKGRLSQRSTSSESQSTGTSHIIYYSWFIAAGVAGILAMTSKQIAVTLPFFVLLYEWFFFQDLRPIKARRAWIYLLLALSATLVLVLLFLGGNPLTTIAHTYMGKSFSVLQRVMSEWRVMIYYISLILFPLPGRLNLDYDYPVSHSLFHPPTTVIALIAVLALLFLAVYTAKKDRIVSFSILWFFGNLAIESTIIGLALIFEHRTYLPSMMICLLVTLLIFRYVKPKQIAVLFLCLAIGVSAIWTYQRNNAWKSEVTLWRDCVKKSPHLPRPHTNLGFALEKKNLINPAISQFKTALQYEPSYYPAYNDLGTCFQKIGDYKNAMYYLHRAIKQQPKRADAYINLGSVYTDTGELDLAVTAYQTALQIDSNNIDALIGMGVACLHQEKLGRAIALFQSAAEKEPGNLKAHLNLGVALTLNKQIDAAILQYQKVIEINPRIAQVYNNLGVLMIQKGNIPKAVEEFKNAVKINSDYNEAKKNLRRALQMMQ